MKCFVFLFEGTYTEIQYSNLTGQFSIYSYTGMNYILYAMFTHLILFCSKLCKVEKPKICFKHLRDFTRNWRKKSHTPTLYFLDNECSRAVKNFLQKKDTTVQMVDAHNDSVLADKPTLKSAKYHTIGHLATIDSDRQIQLWCKFIPQIETTFNLLQTSRVDSSKSAYEALNGKKFDWN